LGRDFDDRADHADTNDDLDPIANSDPDTDFNIYPDTDCDGNESYTTNLHQYTDADPDRDPSANLHTDADPDGDPSANLHGYRNTYWNHRCDLHTNGDTDRNGNRFTTTHISM